MWFVTVYLLLVLASSVEFVFFVVSDKILSCLEILAFAIVTEVSCYVKKM